MPRLRKPLSVRDGIAPFSRHPLRFRALKFRRLFSPCTFAGLVCLLLLSGCAKRSISRSELRSATSEITAACQRATFRKSEITIRPEIASPGRLPVDHIYVTLSNPSQLAALRRAFSSIARRHSLDLSESSSEGITRFDFSFRGYRTQSVHVVSPLPERSFLAVPSSSRSSGAPQLAIIIDDLGYDRAADESVLALPFPLTVSVIPHLPLSADLAEEAYRRGDEVLLHLPMEPKGETKQEEIELRPGMPAREVDSILSGMLETVPHAAGVNNHEGSLATSDPRLMEALMPALRERHLFFIDSRTSPSTVAYATAERFGVRAASRKVFLDDNLERSAILAQLSQAASDAQRDGSVIAIGHPHPETITALADSLPRLESLGFRLVFASDLAH